MAKRFQDRTDAGRQMAIALGPRNGQQTVLLALPRGGVPVAAEIARTLSAPLDLIFVRKIGLPGQPELALGAVADGIQPHIVVNQEVARMANLSRVEIEGLTPPLLAEIERRKQLYLGDRPSHSLSGKSVILVDDGAATGATFKVALASIAQSGAAHVTAALPVAPHHVVHQLRELADEVIYLLEPGDFAAVGQFYENFEPVDDTQVIASLKGATAIADQ